MCESECVGVSLCECEFVSVCVRVSVSVCVQMCLCGSLCVCAFWYVCVCWSVGGCVCVRECVHMCLYVTQDTGYKDMSVLLISWFISWSHILHKFSYKGPHIHKEQTYFYKNDF